jgi:hypothetical protein
MSNTTTGSRTEAMADEAKQTARSAYDRAKADAEVIGEEAKERASEFAEQRKTEVAESLDQFAKAIERASDELRDSDQTLAGQMVREAADGLGQLSRSIGGATTPELVDSLRNFGRRNPAAFLGGAVLAGLALGRFARATQPQEPVGRQADFPGRPPWPGEAPAERYRSAASGSTSPYPGRRPAATDWSSGPEGDAS